LVKRLDDLEKKVENYSIKQTLVLTITIGVLLAFAKPIVDIFIQPLLNMIKSSLVIY
jgi:dCTP deaminase